MCEFYIPCGFSSQYGPLFNLNPMLLELRANIICKDPIEKVNGKFIFKLVQMVS